MSQHRRRRSRRLLPQRLTLLAGFVAAAPLLLLSWLTLRALDEMGSALVAERQALAGNAAAVAEHALQEQLELLAAVGAAPRFDPTDADDAPERAALHAAWRQTRKLESVSLVDASGTLLAREPAQAPEPPAGEVRRLLQPSRPTVSGRLSSPAGPRVLLSAPLRDWRGEVGTWAVGCLDPRAPAWLSLVRPRLPQNELTVTLSDAAGNALAEAGPPAKPGEDRLEASAKLGPFGWTFTIGQPRSLAEGPALRLKRALLLLLPVLAALALAFGWGVARSVTQPVAMLAESAGRIADGDLEEPLPNVGEDEVGRLGRSLEAMRQALQRSFAEVRRANEELERRVLERTREITELNERLRERDRARSRLLRRVITAQEEERKRIARELHDESCQTLAALVIGVDAAAGAGKPAGRLADVKALATRALDGIRALIFDLRPSVLDDLGLFAALRWLAERQHKERGITVRCEFEEPERRIPPEVETALFRVVQEALNNVARHAEADSVLIQIAPRGDDRLAIEIEDDGKGFEPAEVEKPGPSGRGLGLMGMRERIEELLGGRLEIESAPGNGTRLLIEVPLPEANAA